MKNKLQYAAGIVTLALIPPVAADVIYSGLLDYSIPTDFTGITVTVGNGALNPFFGGVGVANNAALQPLRTGTDGLDTILNFGTGSTINASSQYLASGDGGSQDHVGTTFTAGTEGHLGFKLDGTNYGWMRVDFTNNTSGALVKDWAYDNTTGAAITSGNIVQSAVSGGAQTVTLTSASGESFTLGTQLTDSLGNGGGVTNSVVKGGAGTAILTGSNTYSGSTAVNAGTLSLAASASTGNGALTVNNAGTRLLGAGTIGGDTTIGSGAIHSAGGAIANTDKIGLQTFDQAGAGTTNLTYGSGSIFEWDLNSNKSTSGGGARGADYDAVDVSGTLTVDTSAIFRVVLGSGVTADPFWQQTQEWTDIFGGEASLSGGFNNVLLQVVDTDGNAFNQNSLQPGYGFSIDGATLSWSAVPEPANALVGMLLAAGVLRRKRYVAG